MFALTEALIKYCHVYIFSISSYAIYFKLNAREYIISKFLIHKYCIYILYNTHKYYDYEYFMLILNFIFTLLNYTIFSTI